MKSGNLFGYYLGLALEKNTFRRAIWVAIFVGIILNLINNPGLIISFSLHDVNIGQILLTFLVPFCVTIYSSVLSNSNIKPGKLSHIDAILKCKSCNKTNFHVHLGQLVNECPQCKKKTRWKPIEVFSTADSDNELAFHESGIVNIPEININNHLTIDKFREMDYLSVDEYNIPIELMMENAGLQLARLISLLNPFPVNILFGIGTGNNGGGGLVAARRLTAWGYKVFLNIPDNKLHPLPQKQLERALAFGAELKDTNHPDIFVDAYLGFSQRLPLSVYLQESIDNSNKLNCHKISLDLPTGFNSVTGETIFKPDTILTLAAMKTELIPLLSDTNIFIADLGLPAEVYARFDIEQPGGFRDSGLLRCVINS